MTTVSGAGGSGGTPPVTAGMTSSAGKPNGAFGGAGGSAGVTSSAGSPGTAGMTMTSAGESSGGAGGSGDVAAGGEESTGESGGAAGSNGETPLSGALSCATPPLAGGLRPQAYRVTVEAEEGSPKLVSITKGDALIRPTSELETVVDAAADPVNVSETQVSIVGESYELQAARADLPQGVYAGTLLVDGKETPVSCWRDDFLLTFRYQSDVGECSSNAGEPGRNPLPLEVVRETKQGECVTFPEGDLNGEDFTYAELHDWRLAGADLSLSGLHFARLFDADLRGANLDGFSYSYAKITGEVDDYTVTPNKGCVVTETQIECGQ